MIYYVLNEQSKKEEKIVLNNNTRAQQRIDCDVKSSKHLPANIYLFKVNNRSARKRCETCSKLTIKTLERRQWLWTGKFFAGITINDYFIENILWGLVVSLGHCQSSVIKIFEKIYNG